MRPEKEWEEILNDVNLMNKEKLKFVLICSIPFVLIIVICFYGMYKGLF